MNNDNLISDRTFPEARKCPAYYSIHILHYVGQGLFKISKMKSQVSTDFIPSIILQFRSILSKVTNNKVFSEMLSA